MCVYTRSFDESRKLKKAFGVFKNGPLPFGFHQRILKRGDWLDKWKNSYRSGPLGKMFFLIPLRKRGKKPPAKRMPVYLDPRSAFGTGTHETTKLMIRLMETLKGRFGNFFDIGTGTGILSVVAFHLGAGEIWGIDRERNSVRTARFNLERNRCLGTKFFAKDIGKFRREKQFDLVGANLLSETLMKNKGKILSFVHPGRFLALSGIALGHLEVFRKAFQDESLKCLKVIRGRKWGAVLYQKRLEA